MEILVDDLSLPALDAGKADAVALFVARDERPLRGLAGLCDWRLCGSLSRTLLDGFFSGERGEVLLTTSRGRLPAPRIFLFGLGDAGGAAEAAAGAWTKALATLRLAGVRSALVGVPWTGLGVDRTLDVWAAALAQAPERQILLGDPRELQRWRDSSARRVAVDWRRARESPAPDGEPPRGGRPRAMPRALGR